MWLGASTPTHITNRLDYRGYFMSQRWTRCYLFVFAGLTVLGLGSGGVVHAKSTTWDLMLYNSYSYVPQENLLAYTSSGTSFTDPSPAECSDQTLWSLGTATNGTFSGTAVATLRPADFPLLAITATNTISSGIVTDAGQIRMTFVGVPLGLGARDGAAGWGTFLLWPERNEPGGGAKRTRGWGETHQR